MHPDSPEWVPGNGVRKAIKERKDALTDLIRRHYDEYAATVASKSVAVFCFKLSLYTLFARVVWHSKYASRIRKAETPVQPINAVINEELSVTLA